MNNTQTNIVHSFPFLPILTLIFITLKLTGVIAWSWFWVLSPILVPLGIVGLILIVAMLIALTDKGRK